MAAESYVSLTEVSEYAAGVPDELRQARLFPQLPPQGKDAFCFYPMSKRRGEQHNWYALGFEARKELMMGHGKVGRTFHGRVLQVITGSTGLDDYEWGVTLFGVHPDDLKDCVYEMRFDEASAHYAEFGPFYTGMVGTLDDVLAVLGADVSPATATAPTPGGPTAEHAHGLPPGSRRCAASGAWWWRSAVAPTRRSWPRWPTTPSAGTRCCASPPSRRRWPARRRRTAAPWPTSGGCAGSASRPARWRTRRYVANGPDRCARCKTALMAAVGPLAAAEGATVVLGVNMDDLGDHRPGQAAAAAAGAAFPLVDAGFDKAAIRRSSRELGLRTWDKPAAACLSSRLPYGTPVTLGRLAAVEAAEAALRALGFGQLRVRHHGDAARLEVEPAALAEVVARRDEVVAAVRAAGFRFVALDLEGFRSGSLNRGLPPAGTSEEGP